jgi:predicted MFS family arabinose efflux permease
VPDGVRPAPLSLRNWGRVFTSPLLMGLVLITVISGAGQFTLFTYLAPYFRHVLGASAEQVSFLFMWYGAFGLVGNLLLTRWIDRLGAARCVSIGLFSMVVSLLAWPLGSTVVGLALVSLPWALGVFSSNSAQQARLSAASPAFAPALLALNTSAIYAGQAVGAATGGAILSTAGYGALSHTAVVYVLVALALSLFLAWRMKHPTTPTAA